jgi:hypothetical protein
MEAKEKEALGNEAVTLDKKRDSVTSQVGLFLMGQLANKEL